MSVWLGLVASDEILEPSAMELCVREAKLDMWTKSPKRGVDIFWAETSDA